MGVGLGGGADAGVDADADADAEVGVFSPVRALLLLPAAPAALRTVTGALGVGVAEVSDGVSALVAAGGFGVTSRSLASPASLLSTDTDAVLALPDAAASLVNISGGVVALGNLTASAVNGLMTCTLSSWSGGGDDDNAEADQRLVELAAAAAGGGNGVGTAGGGNGDSDGDSTTDSAIAP